MNNFNQENTANELIRPMTEEDLELILSWRNHIDIRRYMYNQHEIGVEEHKKWYIKVSQDPNQHLLIYEIYKKPGGFISFNVKKGQIGDWGFYVAPNSPKGLGCRLGKSALDYAFNIIKLHKVNGQVLGFNEKSIKFHLKLGFTKEGELRDQYFDGNLYYLVVHFGLLSNEWKFNGV